MSVMIPYRPEHVGMARALVAETERAGGLAPVDIERFWADDAVAVKDPFGVAATAHIPQVALGAGLTPECVYAELGIPEDLWRYDHDDAWRVATNRAYNDIAESIVGRRLLAEVPVDPARQYPPVKGLHDVFEAENIWLDQSWWLTQSARNEDQLQALLDRVEARLDAPGRLRGFLLPEVWDEVKERLMPLGAKPPLYRHQRGPVTFATSVYGSENLIYLIIENPDLASRFSRLILWSMLEIARVIDEEAGYTAETAPHGFSFADDNSCLLKPDMYELFGYPVLKGMFERYSPNPGDMRYQHSDSAMGHLLPLLGKLNMTGLNLGPTVLASEIREHLPHAVIYGQLAPFTYMRNEAENIVLEFLRDFDMTRESRGLAFATAGSIGNGTRLTSMRLVMATIQRYGRY